MGSDTPKSPSKSPFSRGLQQKVRSLSISQLESLGEALLDFQNMSDLENWLQDNRCLY
ncbi:DUF4351 domain-containing protein [Dolichospermum compactum]|uniref:DUF4351 domain-containing protein n=1 Tax=Dolichospermum compactum TaxID=136073 RepID=UPI000BBCB723|nr:DUF4351 domain-containing protein [Dolichospermum compactum]